MFIVFLYRIVFAVCGFAYRNCGTSRVYRFDVDIA